MIPDIPGITLKEALEENIKLKERYDREEKVKYIMDIAMRLEGVATHTSTHAAGVLITDERGVGEHVPLWMNDGVVVSQFDMRDLEDLNLLKMDFLGLSTLTVIKYTMNAVKRNYGVELTMDELYNIDEMEQLKLVGMGYTEGLFQIEGEGMTNFLREMKPKDEVELTAGIALYRPGPMDNIPEYLAGKRNPAGVTYLFDAVEDILSETYGVLTYQEQVMQAVVEIAGYDKSDADSFRKIISKKKVDLLPLHKKWFIEGRKIKDYDEYGKLVEFDHEIPGGVSKGYRRSDLEKFFDLMETFGKYAFNKSHSAAYAVLAYVTATLKYHYPAEFMAALMTVEQRHGSGGSSSSDKIARYVRHCREDLAIRIDPPNINLSGEDFNAVIENGARKIVYPLDVKGTSSVSTKAIIEEREENGPYTDYKDFIFRNRNNIDLGTLRGLSAVGALAPLGINIATALANAPRITKRLSQTRSAEKRAARSNREFDFVDWMRLDEHIITENFTEIDNDTRWALEKHYFGLFLSGNPIEGRMYHVNKISNLDLRDLEYDISDSGHVRLKKSMPNGMRVDIVGMFTHILRTATRKTPRRPMAICTFEDLHASVKVFVFPNQYAEYEHMVEEDKVVHLRARLQVRVDEPPALIVDSIMELPDVHLSALHVYFDDPIDAKKFVASVRKDRRSIGSNPIYVHVGSLKFLVDNKYWCNIDRINLDGIKYRIEKL